MSTYNKNNPETIQAMFGSIAADYDRANAILSFQLHKRWNRKLINETISEDHQTILDLCCGTGDISFAFLKKEIEPRTIFMLDFCEEMLHIAKDKAKKLGLDHHEINYLHADAQNIPLKDATVDSATIAYGIRNVQNVDKCLKEVFRVLKSGGTFGILELTRPKNSFLRMGHKVYLSTVLPLLGKAVASNKEAYQYLCNSIQQFVDPKTLSEQLHRTGFKSVKIIPLSCGIATILVAHKA